MIYCVPTSRANKYLKDKDFIVTSDEAEAVSMACGEYLATGKVAGAVMGENGLLNALDALITLANLYEIPVDLHIFPRDDEPQHALVTKGLVRLLKIYKINATLHYNDKQGEYYSQYPYSDTQRVLSPSV